MASEKHQKSPAKIIFGAVLLLIAIIVRHNGELLFYNIWSGNFSANFLTEDAPLVAAALSEAFNQLFWFYLKDLILPGIFLLIPAIFLISSGLASLTDSQKEKRNFLSFSKNSKSEKIFIASLSLLTFIIVLVGHFLIMGHYPTVSDEFSYLFQSDIMAHGKIYADSPPSRYSFMEQNIVNDGKWYSKYTLGWPLLLALGRIVNMDYVVGPLCAALSIIFIYLIGRKFYGTEGGIIAAFFMFFSPFFTFMGCTYFPHIASGLFTLIFIYCIVSSFDESNWIYPILAGLSGGFIFHIRPNDGTLITAGIFPLIIYLFLKSKNRKKEIFKIIPALLSFFFMIGLLMLANYIQTGNPTQFGFQHYNIYEKWGFGNLGHTFTKGLWNVTYAFMRASYWVVPFTILLSIISLGRKEAKTSLMLIPATLYGIFFIGYFGNGILEVGSRFYYPAFVTILIPATGGLLYIRDLWTKSGKRGGKILPAAFIGSMAIFMIFGVYLKMIPNMQNQFVVNSIEMRMIQYGPEVNEPTILFIKDSPDNENTNFNRNFFDLKKEKNIPVLYLTPSENKKILEMFPDRKPYSVIYDQNQKKRIIVPGVDNSETAENYVAGGLNYWHIYDLEKGEKAIRHAIELQPDNPQTWWRLGDLYVRAKNYEKAIPVYEKLSTAPGLQGDALYMLGKYQAKAGKYNDAKRTFETLLSMNPSGPAVGKIADWLKYLKEKT